MVKKGKVSKKTATAEKKPRGQGIGAYMLELLKAGKSTSEVLDAVHKKFPASTATGNDVSIIRCKNNLSKAA